MVDIGLDFLLTPQYGANGAAVANGAAQAMAALGIWILCVENTGLQLRLADFGRIAISGAVMAAGVLTFIHAVPGLVGMFGAIALGGILWVISLRITGALKAEDASRFLSVGGQLPAAVSASLETADRLAGSGGCGGLKYSWFWLFRPCAMLRCHAAFLNSLSQLQTYDHYTQSVAHFPGWRGHRLTLLLP